MTDRLEVIRERYRGVDELQAHRDIAYLLERIDYLQTELWDAQEQAEFYAVKSQGG
jgi:hypothetical protein